MLPFTPMLVEGVSPGSKEALKPPRSKDAALCLPALGIELADAETLRLYLPTGWPRICTRPFFADLSAIFPGITITGYDNEDWDSGRQPGSWALPRDELPVLLEWAELAQQAWSLPEQTDLALPAWLHRQPQPFAPTTQAPKFFETPGGKELLQYQREGVEFGIAKGGRMLLADDMGLGKTVQAIGIAWEFSGEWPVLVTCPSSLRGVWQQQLKKWGGLDETQVQVIYAGSTPIRRDAKWVVVSYALLAKSPTLRRRADGKAYEFLICDECHYVKNPEANRSQAVLEAAATSAHVLLLSGTPILNSAIELFPLLSILDPRILDEETFAKRYFKTTEKGKFGKTKPVWSEPIREKELHTYLFTTVGLRRKKEDVLTQLPPKRRQMIYLATSSADTRALTKLKAMEERLFQHEDEEKGIEAQAITEVLDLVMQAKMKCCSEYVEELIDGGCGKFLLFAHHRKMMDSLEVMLKRRLGGAYIRIDGSTPQVQRPDLVERFQEDEQCHVALLSITALAEGQTLTSAEAVIFAELSWTPGVLLQCEARAHRLGQVGSVLVQFLMLHGSETDERCFRRLERKHHHASMVMDGCAPASLLSEEAPGGRLEGRAEACRGTDKGGMRPKARVRPTTAQCAHPKSRAVPEKE
ncbi:unnamed protein product, partial [Polarella glacialis]